MTEQPTINWPVKPYRIEVTPVRWSMLISFLAYFLTFSGIAGALFILAEMGGR